MKAVSPDEPAIILASGSPRRRQLVGRIGLEPRVHVSEIPEEHRPGESPGDYACRLAAEKARDVESSLETNHELPGWILSADTIVVHDGDILEKPEDRADARAMLSRMAGDRHEVITAFCWRWRAPGGEASRRLEEVVEVRASVWLRELDEDMIARYVDTGEPMDKAGSYGIQDVGGVLVRRLEGSYFCIVGLPVCEVVETLQSMGGLTSYPF